MGGDIERRTFTQGGRIVVHGDSCLIFSPPLLLQTEYAGDGRSKALLPTLLRRIPTFQVAQRDSMSLTLIHHSMTSSTRSNGSTSDR
jgi:hypothetical protein